MATEKITNNPDIVGNTDFGEPEDRDIVGADSEWHRLMRLWQTGADN